MNDLYTWVAVGIIAAVTILLRVLPFIVFSKNRQTPKIIEKLGALLPYAIMGMLVVYCLKDVTFTSLSGFLPALISSVLVGVLYIWKRNTLISIIAGTVCYMILIQTIF
jgi:branched-subunit amino acid transport protein AzlD